MPVFSFVESGEYPNYCLGQVRVILRVSFVYPSCILRICSVDNSGKAGEKLREY